MGGVKGLTRLLRYSVIDFYNLYFNESVLTSSVNKCSCSRTLTNFNPVCTFAGIAERYKVKYAWLGIRSCSYNNALTPPNEPML